MVAKVVPSAAKSLLESMQNFQSNHRKFQWRNVYYIHAPTKLICMLTTGYNIPPLDHAKLLVIGAKSLTFSSVSPGLSSSGSHSSPCQSLCLITQFPSAPRVMSRNTRSRSQLLSVYYNLFPFHVHSKNVLLSMRIKIHHSLGTKQGQKYKMRRFNHEYCPFY